MVLSHFPIFALSYIKSCPEKIRASFELIFGIRDDLFKFQSEKFKF